MVLATQNNMFPFVHGIMVVTLPPNASPGAPPVAYARETEEKKSVATKSEVIFLAARIAGKYSSITILLSLLY